MTSPKDKQQKDKQQKVRGADFEVSGNHNHSRVADLLPDDEDEKKERVVSRLESHVEMNERLARNANRILCRLEVIQANLIGAGNCCESADFDGDAPLFSRLGNSQGDFLFTFAAIESTLDDLEELL